MAVNVQFAVAVHVMAGLAAGCGQDMTSARLARSVNTSPSFVRRVLAKLSKAGLIQTATGKAGSCWLGKDARNISLRDIYAAVGAPPVFAVHTYREQKECSVSCHIKAALDHALEKSQQAMEESLAEISLAQIVREMKKG
ncbi:MAG TPA: Rrf2 family transcriptional regulator [Verrucomicrobiae bacterium]|jgi:Rrf2 family protein|nr:Rrf2 family transcriptional regulator [Verrucomicrobiae bacterium]